MSTIKEEVFINKKYTCSVTGHREVDSLLKKSDLKRVFIDIIDSGYDTFLVGMAVGFDMMCFSVLEELKSDYNFRIIACIPCENQDAKYSFQQKKLYRKFVEEADEKVVLNKQYTPYCMFERNRFLIDNSSLVVGYIRKNTGGTKYTLDYAKKKGVEIRYV